MSDSGRREAGTTATVAWARALPPHQRHLPDVQRDLIVLGVTGRPGWAADGLTACGGAADDGGASGAGGAGSNGGTGGTKGTDGTEGA
jgi:hypothetical protein